MCSFWNVPFLECAFIAICSFWNVPFLECGLFGMFSFWNVLYLECALFGMYFFWNFSSKHYSSWLGEMIVMMLHFCFVLTLIFDKLTNKTLHSGKSNNQEQTLVLKLYSRFPGLSFEYILRGQQIKVIHDYNSEFHEF